MKKTFITKQQFFTILFTYMLSNELFRGYYSRDYQNNVWIPLVMAIPMSIFLFFIYSFIFKNTNYSDFKTAIEKILGPFFSKMFFIIYSIYFGFLLLLVTRDLSELVNLYLMQNEIFWFLTGSLLLVTLYALNKGIECVARYSTIIFFISIISFALFFTLLMIINKPDYANLLPILPNGIIPLLKPALQMSYSIPMGEIFILIIIFQYIKPEQKSKAFKTSYLGIIFVGIINLLIAIANIIFLVSENLQMGFGLTMRLWRKIDLEEFIQRFDLIVLNILVLHVIVKTTVLLLASGKTFGAIFKIKKQKFIFPIICIIIFFLLMIVFTDYTKLIEFRTKIIIPYIKIIFEVFIPILIVIISFLRKNKISKENKQIDYNI
mgnify:CR=1 FL=1